MAHVEADRVKETTTTTGTGAITLAGAATGFRSFSSVMAASDTCFYAIVGTSEWEVGIGTFNTTLARTTVIASSNGNALVSFGAGSKDVFITVPADFICALTNEKALLLPQVAADPSTPASGNLAFYAKNIAGRMVPKVKGPSGLDYPLQGGLWQNNTIMWTPTTATAGVWQGTAGSGSGTYSTALPSTGGSKYQSMKRGRWANVVTTTNQALGQRNTEMMFHPTFGFFAYARFGFDVWTNGGRMLFGIHANTNDITNNPSTRPGTLGFCVDAADNGLISAYSCSSVGVTTKDSTGLTISSNKGYDAYLFCPPGAGSSFGWRIVDINTGAEASGTISTNVSAIVGGIGVLASNAALTTATAIQLGINRIYVETDY